jgi:recombinational DNA repair protein (RecF pathway)
MSHMVHVTEGIVIAVQNTGESSRRIVLCTKDLGCISAVVQSARASKKMSVGVQWMSSARYDCVYGLSGWRVIGISDCVNSSNRSVWQYQAYARRCQYVIRFVAGELADGELFTQISQEFANVADRYTASEESEKFTHFQYTVLHHIGYIPEPLDTNMDIQQLRSIVRIAEQNTQL